MLKKSIIIAVSIFLLAFILQFGVTALALTNAEIENSLTQQFLNRYGDRFNAPFFRSGSDMNIQTGAVDINEVDLSLPGINGMNVNVIRRFNSQRASSEFRFTEGFFQNVHEAGYMYMFARSDGGAPIWVAFDFERNMVDRFSVMPATLNNAQTDWFGRRFINFDHNPSGTVHMTRILDMPPVRRDVTGAQNVEIYNSLSNINIGYNWQIDVPGIFWDETITPDTLMLQTRIGRIRFPSGQVYIIRYQTMRDVGSPWEVTYASIDAHNYEYSIEVHLSNISYRGFSYRIRVIDSDGTQYFFGGGAGNTLFLQAIIDRHGNMIRYQNHQILRNASGTAIDITGYTITDTYGRNISVNRNGISVGTTQVVRYELGRIFTYENGQRRDPGNILRTVNQKTLTVRRPEANGSFSDTRYVMQAREFATRNRRFFNYFYHLDRIEFPTGGRRVFTYGNLRASFVPGTQNINYRFYSYRVSERQDVHDGRISNHYTYAHIALTGADSAIFREALQVSELRVADGTITDYYYDRFDRLTRVVTRNGNNMRIEQIYQYSIQPGDLNTTWYRDLSHSQRRNLRMDRVRYTRNYERHGSTDIKVGETIENLDNRNRPNYSRIAGGLHQIYTYNRYNQQERRVRLEQPTLPNLTRFNLLTMHEYQRDANTWIRTENELSTDNRRIIESRVYEIYRGRQTQKSRTEFLHNPNGTVREVRVFPADGQEIRTLYNYEFNQNGSTMTVRTQNVATNNEGNTTITPVSVVSQHFDFLGRLVQSVDARGHSTHFQHDLQNRMTRQTNPDGTTINISYNTPQNQITVTYRSAPVGNAQEGAIVQQQRYNYDQLGRLERVYAHDGANFVRLGRFVYDNVGRREREYAYRNPARSEFVRERFTFDAFDRVRTRTGYENARALSTVTFTYDLDTTFAFGVRNRRITSSSTGDSHFTPPTTVSVIDTKGRTLNTTLQNPTTGVMLDRVYNTFDFVGNLLTTRGGRARLAGANVYTARFEYNHMNQPVREFNTYGHSRTLNYDRIGRLISESDFYGNFTYFTHDLVARTVEISSPFDRNLRSITRNYFDENGNIIRTRQQNNRQTSAMTFSTVEYAYDNMNRLIQVTQFDGTTRYVTQYAFGDGFNLTRMITGLRNPLNSPSTQGTSTEFAVHQYIYNRLGRLVEYIDPMGQRETYQHDLFGNVTQRTNRDLSVVRATFNAFGQPLSVRAYTHQYGTLTDEIINAFSAHGLRTRMTDATGTTEYRFDQLGRLHTETKGDIVRTYGYAIDGARTSFNLTIGGVNQINTAYQHDRLGRLTHVTTPNGNVIYTFDRNSRMTRREIYGPGLEGVVSTFRHNTGGLVTQMETVAGNMQTSFREDLIYTMDGNISSVHGHNFLGGHASLGEMIANNYAYDGLGRLVWSSENFHRDGDRINVMTDYRFDAFGNRREKIRRTGGNGVPFRHEHTTYVYDMNNRLLREQMISGGTAYTNSFLYDANGNMTLRSASISAAATLMPERTGLVATHEGAPDVWQFAYDGFNRLTRVQNGDMI